MPFQAAAILCSSFFPSSIHLSPWSVQMTETEAVILNNFPKFALDKCPGERGIFLVNATNFNLAGKNAVSWLIR